MTWTLSDSQLNDALAFCDPYGNPNIADGWLTWSVTLVTDTQELAVFARITTDDLRAAEPS